MRESIDETERLSQAAVDAQLELDKQRLSTKRAEAQNAPLQVRTCSATASRSTSSAPATLG